MLVELRSIRRRNVGPFKPPYYYSQVRELSFLVSAAALTPPTLIDRLTRNDQFLWWLETRYGGLHAYALASIHGYQPLLV